MLKTRFGALFLMLMGVTHTAQAGNWLGEASLGYLGTSGNTQTRSINAKVAVDYSEQVWKNAFTASAINSADEAGTTTERYLLTDQVNLNFSERDYVFVSAEFEKDLFGGIRERTSETAGYGRHLLTGPVHKLDAEIGAGARQSREQTTRERQSDAIARASVKYAWEISDSSSLAQSLKSEAGESNVYVESVTELKLSIIGNLSAALSYTVKNNSQVPVDTENMDTFTAVNLVYGFGEKP